MVKKGPNPIPGQGDLFIRAHLAGRETVAPDAIPSAPVEEDSPIGPHVNLMDRSNNLNRALGELAQASRLSGFINTASTDKGHKKLEQQFNHVDRVVGNSQDAKDKRILEAKKAFSRATGQDEVGKMLGVDEAKVMTGQMYDQFVQKFADAKGKNNRATFRRTLKRQQNLQSNRRP